MVERPDLNVNALQKLLKDALTLQERPEPLEVFWQQDTDAEEEINAAKLRYRRSCGADQERALTEFKQKTAARQELISKWESERHELQSAYDQSRGQANTMILDLVAALVTRLGPAHLSQVHLQRLKGLVANPATRGSESPGDFNLNVLNTTDTTGHPPPDELRPNEHRDTRSHPNDTSQEAIVQSAVQLDERTSTHDATQEGYGTNSGVGSKKEGQSHQSDTSVREDTAQDLHSTGAINDVEQGSINLNTVSNNSPEGPITPISLTDHVPVNGDRVSGSKRKKLVSESRDDGSKPQKKKARKAGPWKPIKRAQPYNGHRGTAVDEVDFQNVFLEGKPRHPHWICTHDNESFYIYRCDEHGVTFGMNPALGAAKHLRGDKHNMKGNWQTAYDVLSIKVLNCSAELQAQNNAMMQQRLSNGFDTTKADNPARDLIELYALKRKGEVVVPNSSDFNMFASTASSDEESITADSNPVPKPRVRLNRNHASTILPGEVYQGWHVHAWRPVVALPYGSLEEIGLTGRLEDTGLLQELPPGVELDPIAGEFYRMASGESEEKIKLYPVMLFDGKPTFPTGSTVSVLELQDLRAFDRNASNLNTDLFGREALKYLEGREKRKGATGPVFETLTAPAESANLGPNERKNEGPDRRPPSVPAAEQLETSDNAVAREPEPHVDAAAAKTASAPISAAIQEEEVIVSTAPPVVPQVGAATSLVGHLSVSHEESEIRTPETPSRAQLTTTTIMPRKEDDHTSDSRSPSAPAFNLSGLQAQAFSGYGAPTERYRTPNSTGSAPTERDFGIETSRPHLPSCYVPNRMTAVDERDAGQSLQPSTSPKGTRIPMSCEPPGVPPRKPGYSLPRNDPSRRPISIGRQLPLGGSVHSSPAQRAYSRNVQESPYGKLVPTNRNEAPRASSQPYRRLSPGSAARHDWS